MIDTTTKILAIDPGEHIGYCIYQGIVPLKVSTLVIKDKNLQQLFDWLGELDTDFDVIVSERYMIRPKAHGGFDHSFNSGFTLQVIGAIKAWAGMNGIPLVEQNSDIKIPTHAWAFGKPYKKGSNKHSLDAQLHAMSYLVKHLGVPANAFRGRG